jgi:ribose 5-phosphate isomerase B
VRVGFGSDRIGFECKERLGARFVAQGHEAEEVSTGAFSQSDCHDLADRLASAIYTGRFERGVLVCASAIGASVIANKLPGVRAGLCHEVYSARHGVEDEDMNVLVMGARVVTPLPMLRGSNSSVYPHAGWSASSNTCGTISTSRWPSVCFPGWRK